jgi:hypothetical protein
VNALSVDVKTFPFKLEPIFKVYESVMSVWDFPTPERILTYYDTVVKNKLKDLYFELNPDEAMKSNHHPWGDLYLQGTEIIDNITDMIEMRPILEMKELLDVFQTFHMMHMDDYGEFHNLPNKDVW